MNRSDVIHRLREMGKALQDDECYSDGEFLMDVADMLEQITDVSTDTSVSRDDNLPAF